MYLQAVHYVVCIMLVVVTTIHLQTCQRNTCSGEVTTRCLQTTGVQSACQCVSAQAQCQECLSATLRHILVGRKHVDEPAIQDFWHMQSTMTESRPNDDSVQPHTHARL